MKIGSRIRSRWTLALAWLFALAWAGCSDQVSPPARRPSVAHLQVTANVAGTPVSTLVVQVSAADIQPTLIFNLETVNGTASGTIEIPPGTGRTIVVRAFDASGTETNEGQTTIDVSVGLNPTVNIELLPLAGSQPIDVRIGSLIVTVSPRADSILVGQTIPLSIAITDLLGNPVTVDSSAIRWASFDMRLATVDTKGNVTGADSGDVQVVASYAGAAGAARVSVVPNVVIAAGDIVNDSSQSGTPLQYWVATVHFDTLTAAMLDTMPGAVLPLGDNVYEVGSLTEYTTYYQPSWGRQFARSHPVPGNHEYKTSKPDRGAGYWDYWGTRAGVRDSGYYSFDLGAWHFIALNSEVDTTSATSFASNPEVTWLGHDLAATQAKCVLAYWHRPRFSSGQHGNNYYLQALWDTLYKYHADVVLDGHDHDYERFAPQDPNGNADPNGIREFVVGTGGAHQRGASTLQPNSQVFLAGDSLTGPRNAHGVIRMTLGVSGYSWKFLTTSGNVADSGSGSCH